MGRRQTWDTAEVLNSVMTLFWRQGYARTSVRDVEASTGLHPGSVYKKYGSKDGLLVAAIGHYNDQVVAGRVTRHLLTSADPIAGIHEYFRSSLATAETEPDPGCLLTNTAIESYSLDQPCRAAVRHGIGQLESGFTQALVRAKSLGQLDAAADPAGLAAQLLVLYQGLLVLVRLGRPNTSLDDTVRSAVNAIVGAPAH